MDKETIELKIAKAADVISNVYKDNTTELDDNDLPVPIQPIDFSSYCSLPKKDYKHLLMLKNAASRLSRIIESERDYMERRGINGVYVRDDTLRHAQKIYKKVAGTRAKTIDLKFSELFACKLVLSAANNLIAYRNSLK